MSVPVYSHQTIPIVARSFTSSQDNGSPRLYTTASSVRKSTELPYQDDSEPDTFNIAEYNSSKLRETKTKTNTMMYRRETLKQNLSNIPTPLLLQRVPDGTIRNDSGLDQVVTKTKIVKALQKPKVETKVERSKSDLWKLLAKKYDGKPIGEAGSTNRSVQSRKSKTPRTIGTPNTINSKKLTPRTGNRK